jgi:acyl-CoA thioesterase FadM
MGASPVVKMWTSRIGGKSWDFDYEIKDAKTGVVYATAKTVQVAYDYQLEKSDILDGELKQFVKGLMP